MDRRCLHLEIIPSSIESVHLDFAEFPQLCSLGIATFPGTALSVDHPNDHILNQCEPLNIALARSPSYAIVAEALHLATRY